MAQVHRSTAAVGITILHEPDDPIIDIVFIHGFNGHPERTWTYKWADVDPPSHPDDPDHERPSKFRKLNSLGQDQERNSRIRKETYWPRDLLPRTVEKARVLTFGYDTAVHHKLGGPRNHNTVYDFAWEFLNCLSDARQSDSASRRPLLFIAHSLGGIITKEALRQANLRGAYQSGAHLQNICSSTIGIIFFGTPHRGADPRGFLQHVAEKAVRAAGFTVNPKVFETLLPDSERLKQLLDEFPLLANTMKWKIVSFREMHGMALLGGKKAVDDFSSCLGDFSLEIVRDIESDHRDMCRFSGLKDPRYEKVAAAIHRIVQPLLVVETNREVCMEEPELRSRAGTPEANGDGQGLSEAQHKEMMDRLRFKQMDARLLTLKTAQTKTCRWLLKNRHYKDWINAEKIKEHHGFFWIKGKPGTGKSIMMKFLFWEARRTMKDSIVMSFFFNARGGDLEKSTPGLYRSLLLQLLEKAPETHNILDFYGTFGFNAIKETDGWPNEMLREAFTRATQKLGEKRLVCYIDALDECPEDDVRDMISFFEELGELEKTAEFRVCFSSRHYPEISIRPSLELVLEREQDHKNDITLYIDKHLKIGTNPHAEDIKAEILAKSSNIFLWVALVIPILNKEYDRGRIKALKKRLGETPTGLHELFLDILTRDHKNMDELLVCVQSILFAARPFRPEELRIAVETGCEEDPPDEPCDPTQMTPDNLRKFVLDASKGLAEITRSKEPTVQFIHESVRDFLLKDGGLSKLQPTVKNLEGQGHDTLKKMCLAQFSLRAAELVRQALPESDEHFVPRDPFLQYPLLQYAKDHIYFHANLAQRLGLDQTEFLETFNTIDRFKGNHLLYDLAEHGCADLIRIHPERHKHFQLEGGRFLYPLLAAIYSGYKVAARALLDLPLMEEEPSAKLAQTKSSRNFVMKKGGFNKRRHLISFLCEFGDLDILRAVLQSNHFAAGMPNRVVKCECLQYASSEAIVNAIMEFSTNILEPVTPLDLSKDDEEPTVPTLAHLELFLKQYPSLINRALCWGYSDSLLAYAAERGFQEIAKLCVRDTYNWNIQYALRRAVLGHINQSGRVAIIKLIMDKKPGLIADQKHSHLIFDAMLKPHNEEVVIFLLSTSSLDLETKQEDLTLLLWAILKSRKMFVKLLLSAGADPMARTPEGKAALTLAVTSCDLNSFRCILSNSKCEIDARDNNGLTALSWCATMVADETHIAMALDLIKQPEVDPNSRDNSGETVLTHAIRSGIPKMVEALLKSTTIDPCLASSSGSTPLMLAFEMLHQIDGDQVWEISRLLLLTGKVNPDRRNRYFTSHEWLEIYGSLELVRLVECFYRCREMDQMDVLKALEWPGEQE